MSNFLDFIRSRFSPQKKRTFRIEILVHNSVDDRPFGRFNVDVDAKNLLLAKKRALEVLSLRTGRYQDLSKLNGHKR